MVEILFLTWNKAKKDKWTNIASNQPGKVYCTRIGVTIVPLVLTIVAFFVGDLLQMLINMLLHQGTYYSATKFMHEFLSYLIDDKILSFFYIDHNAYFAIIVMGIINMNAIYMLGGMLFRKTPWLQTSLVLMGIGMAFSALFLSYASS